MVLIFTPINLILRIFFLLPTDMDFPVKSTNFATIAKKNYKVYLCQILKTSSAALRKNESNMADGSHSENLLNYNN